MKRPNPRRQGNAFESAAHSLRDDPPEEDTPDGIDDPSELDEIDLDDERWEAFLADEDERDPQPDVGDFWQSDD